MLPVNAFPCGVVVVFPALGFDVDADAMLRVVVIGQSVMNLPIPK